MNRLYDTGSTIKVNSAERSSRECLCHAPANLQLQQLIIASGSGNGYRLAENVGASNPPGWFECIKVKNPAGYILLYFNP